MVEVVNPSAIIDPLEAEIVEVPATAAPAAASATAAPAEPTAPTGPTVRKIDGPANEPIELSGVAGTAVLKRLLPALGGLVILLLLLRRFGRR
jgi:hypothetical protein